MRVMPAVTWRPIARLIAGNRLFAAVLVPAIALRVDAELGYRWQAWFNDSFSYLRAAVTLTPGTTRAPASAASWRLPSVEPLSATTTSPLTPLSEMNWTALRTQVATVSASLRQGMTTVNSTWTPFAVLR